MSKRVAATQRQDAAAQVATALESDDERHVSPFSEAFLGALVHDVNLVLGAYPGAWRVTDAAGAGDGSLGLRRLGA